MPRSRFFALGFLLAAPLAACSALGDREADEAKLMQTSRDWARAAASGDVDAILAYWADDAVVLSPDQPTLRGKAEIRQYLERMMKAPGFRISWQPQEAHLSAAGDMGYLIERTSVTVNGPDGRPVTQSFRGVTVWRRQADGSWKNVVDISNAEPAPAPRA